MTHSDIKAWCAKCGEPATVLALRAPASLTIGVPCDCDAGMTLSSESDDRLRALAQAYQGLADHLMECAKCWHGRKCVTRHVIDRDIRQLEECHVSPV